MRARLIGITIGVLTRLVRSETSPICVAASDLAQLAEKLGLAYSCVSQPFPDPAATQLSPGFQLLIPTTCCEDSCRGALCQQRPECTGEDTSVQPADGDVPSVAVTIVEEASTMPTTTSAQESTASSNTSPDNTAETNPALASESGTSDSTSVESPSIQTPSSQGPTRTTLGTVESTANPSMSTITDSPIATSPLSRGTPAPGIAITLDGESYVLPVTGSVDLLQPDGSTITLFPQSAVSGSQTVSFDASSQQTGLTLGAATITQGNPTPESAPEISGATGFGGLVDSLDSLAGNAGSIVETLDSIDDLGRQWHDGSLSASQFSSSVGSLFDDAVSSLSAFESTMRSTLQTFAPQTLELTDDGWRQVSGAYGASQRQLDITSNLRGLTRSITKLKNLTITKLKGYWLPGAAVAVATAERKRLLQLFAAHDWQKEKQQTVTSTSSNTTEAVRPTRRRTSTSESATPTAVPYLLSTKKGTDPKVFDSYLESIGKVNEGPMTNYPSIPWQSQIIKLTAEEAEDAKSQPFMYIVSLVTEPGEEPENYSVPAVQERQTGALAPRDLVRRKPSEWHLKMLSTRNEPIVEDFFADMDNTTFRSELLDYLYDPVLGKGQTIYVIDDGFNIEHEEFAPGPSGRSVTSHYLPNDLTLPNVPANLRMPEDIRGWTDHGTNVASIAGGLKYGVASNANLVLVKFKNAARNEYNTGSIINRLSTVGAVEQTWSWVIQDIERRRQEGDQGKFIVNLSSGSSITTSRSRAEWEGKERAYRRAMEECWEKDIITVVAAGNAGDNEEFGGLDASTPQNIGAADNAMITVGGVTLDGKLWKSTSFDRGRGGSLSVFGLSFDVVGAGIESTTATSTMNGTSHAAPAVAGIAAYFASLESLATFFQPGSVAMTMKEYIMRYAYVRNQSPIPDSTYRIFHPPPPHAIKVAYNRAPEGLCSASLPRKRSALGSLGHVAIRKRQDGSEDDVLIDGDVVDEEWVNAYCALSGSTTTSTQSGTPTGTPTTLATTTSEPPTASPTSAPTSPPPAPTVDIDQGILTCGTGTHDDGKTAWFGLDEMTLARNAFCGNMSHADPPVVFKPGEIEFQQHLFTAPGTDHVIKVSANWAAGKDSDCPAFDFSETTASPVTVDTLDTVDEDRFLGYVTCVARLGIPINNCDTFRGSNVFWKQGGKFLRDCIEWEITSAGE